MKLDKCTLIYLSAPFFFLATASASLNTGLLAYYDFESAGTDASGSGLDVTFSPGSSFEPGLFGTAFAPNGNNNHFATRPINDPVLNFGTADFTLQSWVNFNNTGGEQVLVEKFTGNSGPGWSLTKLSDNRIAFVTDIGSSPTVIPPIQSLALDSWHNITVRNTSGFYEMFLDGDVIQSLTAPTANSSSTAPLLIGKRNSVDGRDFSVEGSLDEIAIWSRSLSDSEVAYLYDSGAGNVVPEPANFTLLLGLGGIVSIFIRRKRSL